MKLTDEGIKRRDELLELAQKHGIVSLRQLCIKAGVESSNLYANFNGNYDISIKRMFKLANAMNEDIVEIIKAFHPTLYKENQECKLPVDEQSDH